MRGGGTAMPAQNTKLGTKARGKKLQNKQPFETVYKHAATGIAITNLDGVFEQCNPAYCALLGYTEEELHQIAFASLVHPEDRQANLAQIRRLRAGEVTSFEIENRYVHKRGHAVWVRKWVSILPDETGQPAHLMALVTDITERKRAEESLRESEQRLRLMADALPVLIAYIGADGCYQFNNAGYEHWFGLPPNACMGRHMRDVLGEAAFDALKEHVEAALNGQSRTFEAQVPYQTAGLRTVLANYVPHRNADGKVLGFYALILDLTERLNAEEAVRNREARLAAILKTAADAIITIDAHGSIQSVNAAAEKMFGFAAAEMIGQDVKILMPSPVREEHDRYLEDYDKTGVKKIIGIGREVVAQRKDGSTFPIELAVSEVEPLKLFTGILRDISRRKQIESALYESERFARAAFDGLSAHIAVVRDDGTILAVNRAWRDFASANGAIPGRADEGANYFSVCNRSAVPYSEEGPSVAAGIRAVLESRLPEFIAEYPCNSPQEYRWFTMRVVPFPGDGPRRVIVAHEDITKRKELERDVVEIASLEQRRIGQDLHDSVGQELTALNLLTSELAEVLRTDPSSGSKLVGRMVKGLKRSQRELRAVMRGLLPVAVDAEGLMAALADLAESIRHEGKTNCHFDCREPVTVADNLVATHLYLIVQEAVHNSVKHAQPKNIWISMRANHVLVLRVQDDGIGMPARPAENHGGLGLRIMHNRAAIIGATISIKPAEPTGTLVTCVLVRKDNEKEPD
jgi:PAS domain S-box-containing protein